MKLYIKLLFGFSVDFIERSAELQRRHLLELTVVRLIPTDVLDRLIKRLTVDVEIELFRRVDLIDLVVPVSGIGNNLEATNIAGVERLDVGFKNGVFGVSIDHVDIINESKVKVNNKNAVYSKLFTTND